MKVSVDTFKLMFFYPDQMFTEIFYDLDVHLFTNVFMSG